MQGGKKGGAQNKSGNGDGDVAFSTVAPAKTPVFGDVYGLFFDGVFSASVGHRCDPAMGEPLFAAVRAAVGMVVGFCANLYDMDMGMGVLVARQDL